MGLTGGPAQLPRRAACRQILPRSRPCLQRSCPQVVSRQRLSLRPWLSPARTGCGWPCASPGRTWRSGWRETGPKPGTLRTSPGCLPALGPRGSIQRSARRVDQRGLLFPLDCGLDGLALSGDTLHQRLVGLLELGILRFVLRRLLGTELVRQGLLDDRDRDALLEADDLRLRAPLLPLAGRLAPGVRLEQPLLLHVEDELVERVAVALCRRDQNPAQHSHALARVLPARRRDRERQVEQPDDDLADLDRVLLAHFLELLVHDLLLSQRRDLFLGEFVRHALACLKDQRQQSSSKSCDVVGRLSHRLDVVGQRQTRAAKEPFEPLLQFRVVGRHEFRGTSVDRRATFQKTSADDSRVTLPGPPRPCESRAHQNGQCVAAVWRTWSIACCSLSTIATWPYGRHHACHSVWSEFCFSFGIFTSTRTFTFLNATSKSGIPPPLNRWTRQPMVSSARTMPSSLASLFASCFTRTPHPSRRGLEADASATSRFQREGLCRAVPQT